MLRAKVNYPIPNIGKSRKALDKQAAAQVLKACQTWVISTSDAVPVLTGASKASFIKVASAAKLSLAIQPRAPSRIPLGIGTSKGEFFAEPGKRYGWEWSSDLDYIQYVDAAAQFLKVGQQVIDKLPDLELPELVYDDSND